VIFPAMLRLDCGVNQLLVLTQHFAIGFTRFRLVRDNPGEITLILLPCDSSHGSDSRHDHEQSPKSANDRGAGRQVTVERPEQPSNPGQSSRLSSPEAAAPEFHALN